MAPEGCRWSDQRVLVRGHPDAPHFDTGHARVNKRVSTCRGDSTDDIVLLGHGQVPGPLKGRAKSFDIKRTNGVSVKDGRLDSFAGQLFRCVERGAHGDAFGNDREVVAASQEAQTPDTEPGCPTLVDVGLSTSPEP